LAAIAVHEAGHFEASIALGIPATMRIDIDDAGNLRGGWCFQDFEGPPFENSCIAWAGIIAENLSGLSPRHTVLTFCPVLGMIRAYAKKAKRKGMVFARIGYGCHAFYRPSQGLGWLQKGCPQYEGWGCHIPFDRGWSWGSLFGFMQQRRGITKS